MSGPHCPRGAARSPLPTTRPLALRVPRRQPADRFTVRFPGVGGDAPTDHAGPSGR